MLCIACIFLLRDTEGLIEVNSFIVPALLCTITLILILYFLFCKDSISLQYISSFEPPKDGVFISTILYAGYNILCCSGVLVPLSNETKNSKAMVYGIAFGALGLTLLSGTINLLLLANQPYIFELEIPLLLVAQRFGNVIQALLLVIIWLEMFSTEVSDVYSISKTLEQSFNIILLLLLSNFGKEGKLEPVIPSISQEILAARVGTTRPRINFFIISSASCTSIEYNGSRRPTVPS